MCGERPRGRGRDKIAWELCWERDTLALSCASEQGHGEWTCQGGRSLLGKGRFAQPGPVGSEKTMDRGGGLASLGLATQSMIRGPAAWVLPQSYWDPI